MICHFSLEVQRKQTVWIRQQSAVICPKQELLFQTGLMHATKYAKNAGPFVVLLQIPSQGKLSTQIPVEITLQLR